MKPYCQSMLLDCSIWHYMCEVELSFNHQYHQNHQNQSIHTRTSLGKNVNGLCVGYSVLSMIKGKWPSAKTNCLEMLCRAWYEQISCTSLTELFWKRSICLALPSACENSQKPQEASMVLLGTSQVSGFMPAQLHDLASSSFADELRGYMPSPF